MKLVSLLKIYLEILGIFWIHLIISSHIKIKYWMSCWRIFDEHFDNISHLVLCTHPNCNWGLIMLGLFWIYPPQMWSKLLSNNMSNHVAIGKITNSPQCTLDVLLGFRVPLLVFIIFSFVVWHMIGLCVPSKHNFWIFSLNLLFPPLPCHLKTEVIVHLPLSSQLGPLGTSHTPHISHL